MAQIAIVRLRTVHDVELRLNRLVERALRFANADSAIARMEKHAGLPTLPQMTLPYLAGLIEQYMAHSGIRHNYVLIDESEERARALLDQQGPFDMVWFTVNTPAANATYKLSEELTRTGNVTVLGGIHASVLPNEAANFATTVCTGEGEVTVGRVLEDWDAHHRLARRYDGGRTPSLAELPEPRWEALGSNPLVLPVQTSRGCRNACSFCSTTRFQGTRRRHRPVRDIVEEIQRHRDAGRLDGAIFFTDNNIVSDTDHRRGVRDTSYARELFEALIPLDVRWTGQGEINLADDAELVELAALSGCQTLLVGLETLDQANLTAVHKPSNSVERYAEQIEVLHSWGISLIGCFIFGLDQDTPEVFDVTRRFINRYVDIPQLSIMTPFPGTALYRQLQREGRLLHDDWSQYDILNVTYKPNGMTPGQLRDGFADLATRTFRLSNILSRSARFAASVNRGPAHGESWLDRVARVLAPNLYYRSICTQSRPSTRPVALPRAA